MRRALLVGALLLGACVPGSPDVWEPAEDTMRAGRPLGRSLHLRSGHLTYRLGQVDQEDANVRVGVVLMNGSHRDYQSLILRVILHGPEGRQREDRLVVGPFREGASRGLSAWISGVPFPVQDVSLELVLASP